MDDTISRQAAIDAIGALSDTIFKNIEKGATYPPRAWFAGMANAESIIKDLPSIDAVPVKHGRWTIEDCHSATYKYCCSICGAHHRARYDYCPTCGACMED